jgi:hypothetical protein
MLLTVELKIYLSFLIFSKTLKIIYFAADCDKRCAKVTVFCGVLYVTQNNRNSL